MCKNALKAAALTACILMVVACTSQPATRVEALDQYLVTTENLPAGWIISVSPERFTENYGQANDLYVEFKNNNHVAWHLVLAYGDAQNALDNYRHLVPAFLHVTTATVKSPYSPKDISFSSNAAQEFTLKCEVLEFTPTEICMYIAAYDDKVVVFNTHLTPEVMSSDDLEKVLFSIDKKMQN
jgi:hypothetical protein